MSYWVAALVGVILVLLAQRYDWTGARACEQRGGVLIVVNFQHLCVTRDVLR